MTRPPPTPAPGPPREPWRATRGEVLANAAFWVIVLTAIALAVAIALGGCAHRLPAPALAPDAGGEWHCTEMSDRITCRSAP